MPVEGEGGGAARAVAEGVVVGVALRAVRVERTASAKTIKL